MTANINGSHAQPRKCAAVSHPRNDYTREFAGLLCKVLAAAGLANMGLQLSIRTLPTLVETLKVIQQMISQPKLQQLLFSIGQPPKDKSAEIISSPSGGFSGRGRDKQ